MSGGSPPAILPDTPDLLVEVVTLPTELELTVEAVPEPLPLLLSGLLATWCGRLAWRRRPRDPGPGAFTRP